MALDEGNIDEEYQFITKTRVLLSPGIFSPRNKFVVCLNVEEAHL